MKKPTRKPNKIVKGLQEALTFARERVAMAPVFNAHEVLCVGGRAIVTDHQGRPWLLDADKGEARPVTMETWVKRD